MKGQWRLFWALLIIASLLLTWLFMGIVFSFVDEEKKSSFFVKTYPTFKVAFYNLDNSDSDYIPFPDLSPQARHVVAEYCKYRYGVTKASEIESSCRKNMNSVGVDSGQSSGRPYE